MRFTAGASGYFPHVMSPAENFIANNITAASIADDNLLTFGDHYTIDRSCVMRRSLATPTKRFNLQSLNSIGKLH
jgi:hypothetical protein